MGGGGGDVREKTGEDATRGEGGGGEAGVLARTPNCYVREGETEIWVRSF